MSILAIMRFGVWDTDGEVGMLRMDGSRWMERVGNDDYDDIEDCRIKLRM